ncbi:hypothetical protein chiPu_0012703 [Chiloscyllium punctatum]|uniref:Uncharacterized protein n=1 Tax=Chiloscyllium punctatum TaxID=137246 RepID=A0A401SV19_CHIPU|nr:hypothetical protein [Chiloscyllium punctatum]
MCDQAARYCRVSVQQQPRDKQPPLQRSIRGLDGVLRWVFTKMSDKKFGDRESQKTEQAASSEQLPLDTKKGISVILDVSSSLHQPLSLPSLEFIPTLASTVFKELCSYFH